MTRSNRSFSLAILPVLLAAAASVACGDSQSSDYSGSEQGGRNAASSPAQSPGNESTPSNGSAERAIAEADIVQLASGRLYAMSKSGTLSIIDVSKPGRLVMLGQAYLPGEPFEMYLRGDLLVAMTNGAYAVTGQANEPSSSGSKPSGSSNEPASGAPTSSATRDPNAGAGVIVINVKDPGLLQRVATFPVAGEIADSRIVGDILYLATYETSSCYRCGTSPRTLVTSFDLSTPTSMRQVDQATFENGSTYYAAWGTAWRRSIFATTERMYVGGHGDLATNSGGEEGVIDVLDVTDPTGKLGKGAHITTTGAITSRWQMDEKDGVLRVVSQRGIGYVTNGIGQPDVQTFNIWNTRSLQAMGKKGIKLPRQEALKTVRFDGERAYAITYAETDPLFIIDLADAALPKQRGEIHMPGYVFHLEPHGTRLLGLGLDRNDSGGNLNVSLFDVADMDNPSMLQRVSFGSKTYNSDTGIANLELPEDQDRIQKAFRVLGDGLIVAPYSGAPKYTNGSYDCSSTGGGIQLIDWTQDTLTKQATLPVAGNPRRALANNGELLAVSDSNVTSFDLGRRDVALKTADLVIGSCEARSFPSTNTPIENGFRGNDQGNFQDDYYGPRFLCALTAPGAHGRGSLWAGLGLGLAAIAGVVRRRRQA